MEVRYLSKNSGGGIPEAVDFEKHFNGYGAQVFNVEVRKPYNEALSHYVGTKEVEIEKLESICSFKQLLPLVPEDIQLPYDGFKPNFAHQNIPDCALTLTSLRALKRRRKDENKKLHKTVLRYRGEVNLDVDTAAMIYLGNNFYIDTRNPENADYSQTICEWGVAKGYKLGKVFKMEETTWYGVKELRLGYPYLYTHQRTCEHLIVITDARNDVIFFPCCQLCSLAPNNKKRATKVKISDPCKDNHDVHYWSAARARLTGDVNEGLAECIAQSLTCCKEKLLHESDCMDSTKYPIMRSFANLQGKFCAACRKKPSKYLVIGNDKLPHKVAHFCTICLTLFNYVNRIKIGNFQVYKYVDRASLI